MRIIRALEEAIDRLGLGELLSPVALSHGGR
jgi:hypothetical protein